MIAFIQKKRDERMHFHFDNWLIYFYFYCIFGWVFESTYVSLRTRKLTNRGFMKGPWLPLYGSGAIVILLATMPFKQYPVAVYFAGVFAATLLEYVTGELMLKLFKVRYWDYSNQKLQFRGHICLSSSIAWGFLSLLMVYVVHGPVAKFISLWNEEVLSIVTFLITILMVFDFANAFRNAMDLRALIIQAEELKKRLNAALTEEKERLADVVAEKMEQHVERKEHITQTVAEAKEQLSQAVEDRKEHFAQTVAEAKEQLAQAADERKEQREKRITDLEVAMEQLKVRMEERSKQLLLHNPGSSYKGLIEESKEIKRRLQERRRK